MATKKDSRRNKQKRLETTQEMPKDLPSDFFRITQLEL